MALYRLSNPAAMASQTMGQAAQSVSSMQKKTERRRDDNLLRDIQAGVGIAQGIAGLADKSWDMYDKYQERDAVEKVNQAYASGGDQGVDDFLKTDTGHHIKKAGEAHKAARHAETMRAHDASKREHEALKMKRDQEDLEADDMVAQWRQEKSGKDWLDGRQMTPAAARAVGRHTEKQLGIDVKRAQINSHNALSQYREAQARAGAKGGGAVTLSDRDRSILMKYSENEDGETDHGKAALLEAISMRTGMTPFAAIHSYDSSVKNAMTKGLSRADAERAVYSEYTKRLGGGGGEQPSSKEEEPKPQAQPQDKTAERIRNAVDRKPDDQPQKPAAGIMLDPDVRAGLEEDERLYGY